MKPLLYILPQKGQDNIVLSDKNVSGKEKAWKVDKQMSLYLAETFFDLGQEKRADRIRNCASHLVFLQCQEFKEHPKKLISAHFCKERLCPMCQQRKSVRQFKASMQLGHELLKRYPSYKFIFLTLTVPNVQLDELGKTITHIFESWQRLTQRGEVKQAMRGYLRTLEVTYNHLRNDWHPHIHAALVVPSSYFTTEYIRRDRWLQMWQEATRQPEITQVDIRKIKPNPNKPELDALASAFAEVAKYALKQWSTESKQSKGKLQKQKTKITRDIEGHAWMRSSREETAAVIEKLQAALHKRRLVQVGGILRDIKRELKIKDGEDEDADLVNTSDRGTGCQCAICAGEMREVWYYWREVLGNYCA